MNTIIKKELATGIWVYSNLIEDCDMLVKNIKEHFDNQYIDSTVFVNDKVVVDKNSRDCQSFIMNKMLSESYNDQQNNIYNNIQRALETAVKDYREIYEIPNVLTSSHLIVLKYNESQKFENHVDDGPHAPRTISLTAYLNDDYSGGELIFKYFNISYKPVKGDIIVFPSNFIYAHKVSPVLHGTRHSVVNWFRWNTLAKKI